MKVYTLKLHDEKPIEIELKVQDNKDFELSLKQTGRPIIIKDKYMLIAISKTLKSIRSIIRKNDNKISETAQSPVKYTISEPMYSPSLQVDLMGRVKYICPECAKEFTKPV